jgi:hypothetical protein
MIDEPDEHEFFARYASKIPTADKLKIVQRLLQTARSNGAVDPSDVLYYLNDPELELLVGMIGKRFPIREEDFADALEEFFLSFGKSAESGTAAN